MFKTCTHLHSIHSITRAWNLLFKKNPIRHNTLISITKLEQKQSLVYGSLVKFARVDIQKDDKNLSERAFCYSWLISCQWKKYQDFSFVSTNQHPGIWILRIRMKTASAVGLHENPRLWMQISNYRRSKKIQDLPPLWIQPRIQYVYMLLGFNEGPVPVLNYNDLCLAILMISFVG